MNFYTEYNLKNILTIFDLFIEIGNLNFFQLIVIKNIHWVKMIENLIQRLSLVVH